MFRFHESWSGKIEQGDYVEDQRLTLTEQGGASHEKTVVKSLGGFCVSVDGGYQGEHSPSAGGFREGGGGKKRADRLGATHQNQPKKGAVFKIIGTPTGVSFCKHIFPYK